MSGLGQRRGGGGGFSPQNSRTPLGVTHWLTAVSFFFATFLSFYFEGHNAQLTVGSMAVDRVVDGRDNAWRSRAPGPHAHGNAAR